MANVTTTWAKIKEVYVGNDGYHDVYWRMYARISAQSEGSTTVNVQGRLFLTGSVGSVTCGATTTCGGLVGNYSAWGVNAQGTYSVGETTLWDGSDTTYGNSIEAGVRFYSSPWGWTGENLFLSDTLVISSYSAPSGLLLSGDITVGPREVKANALVQTYGNPSSATGRYLEVGVVASNSWTTPRRSEIIYNTTPGTARQFIVNNSSSAETSLTIQPNTHYYLGIYANNTVLSANNMVTGLTTTPDNPELIITSRTPTAISYKVTVPTDGGYLKRTVELYRNGAALALGDIPAGDGTSREYTGTWTGFDPDVNNSIFARVRTSAGVSDSETIVIRAGASPRIYGSVSDEATFVNKLYGPVNGQSREIIKLYGSSNGKTKLIKQSFKH